jgi:NitT/TauT family transport system substrate-binding protein
MASKMVYVWIGVAVAIAIAGGVGFSLTAPTSPTTAKSPDTENIQEAAATETAATLDKVTLRLKWLHQAQFAGFYTADQKGFYEKNGIDVTINPGGIDFPAIQMVSGGSEQFGVTGADQIIVAREKGVPIVALAVIYRETPFVLFSLNESGIAEPKDFIDKNVGVKLGGNEELTYRAMMKGANVDTSLVKEVPVKFDISPLLSGQVDVWPGYAINEPITAEEKGYSVNLIWPKDYGVEMYADTLFTTEDMINNNPDLVKRFVNATLQGWNYAYNSTDEAVSYTLMYSDILAKDHETRMMQASLKSLKPDDKPIGTIDVKVLEGMQTILLENGYIKMPIDLEKAFTNRFLQ